MEKCNVVNKLLEIFEEKIKNKRQKIVYVNQLIGMLKMFLVFIFYISFLLTFISLNAIITFLKSSHAKAFLRFRLPLKK